MSKQESSPIDQLVCEWVLESQKVKHLEAKLKDSIDRRDEAAQKLGESIAPSDIQLGETISIWVGYKGERRLVTVHFEDRCPRAVGEPFRCFSVKFRGDHSEEEA